MDTPCFSPKRFLQWCCFEVWIRCQCRSKWNIYERFLCLKGCPLTSISCIYGYRKSTFGYDNGPQVIGCDFRESSTSKPKAEICFIPSSGMQMGIGWIVIRPESTKYYYRLRDNHGAVLSNDERWQKAEIKNGQICNSDLAWKGEFTYRTGQCRPGGRDASIYEISNGAKFCLYY